MRKQFVIGKFSFATKGAAKMHIQRILNETPKGVILAGDEREFVASLLQLHPSAGSKLKGGVAELSVDGDGRGGRCFHTHKLDGTRDDFSYLSCLSGKKEEAAGVKDAFRRAIDPQIWAFRDSRFAQGPIVCPYSGETVNRKHYHVDHIIPFADLLNTWLATHRLELGNIQIAKDEQFGYKLVDETLRASWQEYHRENAKLQMLSPQGNMRKPRVMSPGRV